MNNQLIIENNQLKVLPRGLNKIWAFKNKIEIPIHHVLGATVDNNILKTKKGMRRLGLGGTNKWAGTWILDGEKIFWNVSRKDTPIVIQLKNEKFSRLVIGVEHADEWTDRINNLIGQKNN